MRRFPAAARDGIRAALPLLIGLVPFGLVAGVAAVSAGLSPAHAMGMSVIIFAGAAQLAVIDLLGTNSPLAVAAFTGIIVNLRMMMYSASIAPYFRQHRTRWKAVLAYFLTDQAYAVSLARYQDGDDLDGGRDWFYLGVAASLWTIWLVTTAVGIAIGRGLPSEWGLEFAVPLVFLALLVPQLKSRPSLLAGGTAGLVAVVATGVPYQLGLPIAAAVGVVVGLVSEEVLA